MLGAFLGPWCPSRTGSIEMKREHRTNVLRNHYFAFVFLLLLGTLLTSVAAQDKSRDSTTAKVEFENEQIRVLRVSLGPHEKGAVHSHPSRLGVTLASDKVRVYFPDGSTKTTTSAAHEYFWSEPVTHQVENISDTPMQNIEIELKQANAPGVEVKPAGGDSIAQGTAADPVAVEQEPHHHVVFENQYVRVLDVVVQPGETTLFHRHSLDNVAVQLSDATIRRQYPGQDWVTSPAKAGSVGFTAGTKIPYVHRITNIGSAVFHVMDIEILP
jgi:quercetin dioxygenase-like cupin family protein